MTAEEDAIIREAVADMIRDHTMPPNKDRHGYDYRMGWWDAVTYLDSLVKSRVRESRPIPPEKQPGEAPLPCCVGQGACQAPPDIGPCDPLPPHAALADRFAAMCTHPATEPHKCNVLIAAHDAARIVRETRCHTTSPRKQG